MEGGRERSGEIMYLACNYLFGYLYLSSRTVRGERLFKEGELEIAIWNGGWRLFEKRGIYNKGVLYYRVIY